MLLVGTPSKLRIERGGTNLSNQATCLLKLCLPKFPKGLLKVYPALRKSFHFLAEGVKGVVQFCSQLSLRLLCHQVVPIVHVLSTTQVSHYLSNLQDEVGVEGMRDVVGGGRGGSWNGDLSCFMAAYFSIKLDIPVLLLAND